MESQERDRIAAFLDGAVSAGASSQDVADVVATALRSIETALAPIVGSQGVATLYKRSVHLTRQTLPWIPALPAGDPASMDVAALTTALAQRTAAEAAAAGTLLLQTFHGLLTGLIGPSVTERLLRSVWITFLSGPSARDNSP